jgi:4-alpha-glucanotransferase
MVPGNLLLSGDFILPMHLHAKANALGFLTEYVDAFGQTQRADERALGAAIEGLGSGAPFEQTNVPVQPAWDGDVRRGWIVAVQLYSLRSPRSWGIGDFGDLKRLLQLAGEAGACGVGLNPLHVLFHEEASDCSPYWPSSRLFLNPLYIDFENVPELTGAIRERFRQEIETLNGLDLVDYAGVAKIKRAAARHAFEEFRRRRDPARQRSFDNYKGEQGAKLRRFCVFETLRRRFAGPWWNWPTEWQNPSDDDIETFMRDDPLIEATAFEQWLAHTQLDECAELARELKMSVGLYLDIAVGVRPDGFDAWSEQRAIFRKMAIGAPPDLLNVKGQDWGLAGFSPTGLAERSYEPFQEMLAANMKFAGAVRIDHVLGLKRIFLVPAGFPPTQGIYLNMPLDRLLAVLADQSRKYRCIVIGEDLGTVPDGFRETMATWGIWSYRVMIFERDWTSGNFVPPSNYAANALATFSTHDLPPFMSWVSGADRVLRQKLGMDPGETEEQRQAARTALDAALEGRLREGFTAVAQWLGNTPSRLISISTEDVLALTHQVNVPGTTTQHPNWRFRLRDPEELQRQLMKISKILEERGGESQETEADFKDRFSAK